MSKKTVAVIGAIAFVGVLCASVYVASNSIEDKAHSGLENIEHSFAHVLVSNNMVLKACISPPGKPSCETLNLPPVSPTIRTMGSGAVVAHGMNTTYVITAGHVCTFDAPTTTTKNGYVFLVEPRVDIKVQDFWGNMHATTVVAVDHQNDICILRSRGIWSKPLPVAKSMPKPGEMVTTIAAPRGMFHPGMVLRFDGRYVGVDSHGHAFFTTPTAPGSSGSVILNSKGQIVCVIHSAMRRFENVGLGSQIEDVIELLRLNVSNVSSAITPSGYLGTFKELP